MAQAGKPGKNKDLTGMSERVLGIVFAGCYNGRPAPSGSGAGPVRMRPDHQAGASRKESAGNRRSYRCHKQRPQGCDLKEHVMPKMKTNRAAAKRFRKTASGKFKCGHAFKSHILTKKSTKRKRGLRAPNHVRAEDAGRVQRMLPYL